jgi:hypothetical protein
VAEFKELSRNLPLESEEEEKNLRIINVPDEIRNGHLHSISQKRYGLSQLDLSMEISK